ncbi:MAG TPA: hypothetical protein VHM88_18380 [Candidatus Acidoferrales bacterium]|jgi:hypothetical protein|nr:hypothetical protein [Candidatus Acidoferrales bacterium]
MTASARRPFSGVFPLSHLLALFPLLPVLLLASDTATLTYRRVFKGSVPEFIEIKVSENGAAVYDIRQLDEPPNPQPFEVGSPLRAKLFELAAQLNDFRGLNLDVRRRIANLGEKTFRWERDGETHEVSFNYTLNATANQLTTAFEGLARQQEHLISLQQRMKYDRLGVNEALMQFESDLNHKILPEPQRLLPVLEQIANDSRFVEIARQRARNLAERIRSAQDH